MLTCYRANLESRLATRVLMRLGRAPYRDEQDVYEAAFALKWPEWFGETQSIRVDVNAIRSPLKSLEFATLRIKDAVCDRFRADRGRRPDVDTRSPEVRIQAFLDKTAVTLYLDTSGEVLNRRGYRRDAGEAPLKENLAAGIVGLTGWGAGRGGEGVKKARLNLEAAGLADCVELKQADVLDTGAPAGAGVLIANPPYGARIGEDTALAELYPKLGNTLKKYYAGWRCYLFSGDTRLPKLIRLTASRRTPLYNGPLECRLYEYRIVAGSNRRKSAIQEG